MMVLNKVASYLDGDDLCGRYVDYDEVDVPFVYSVIPSGFSETYIVVTEDPVELLDVSHISKEKAEKFFKVKENEN